MPRLLLLALVALVAALAGCGGEDSSSSVPGNPTDRAFVKEMVPHHRSAVEMAQVARERGQSAFVKDLAEDIIRTQNAEIARLERIDAELAGAGVKTGKLPMGGHSMESMSMDASELETAEPFDRRFVEMMVPHHEGAVEMARVQLQKGSNPELEELARAIIEAQRREIELMRARV